MSNSENTRIRSIEELNAAIRANGFAALIHKCEAHQLERIKRVAVRIAAQAPVVRLVLLAGPSSAGKTTTAIRLVNELTNNGITTMRLSTDDYFVGDERNPRNPDGSFDYETVEAVDRERLRSDLASLFEGQAVNLRKFDFKTKEGFDSPTASVLQPGGVVILEGIHALNPILTDGIPERMKFRVYINVLNQLESEDVWLSTDDTRLLRRIVRDSNYRNLPADATLKLWPSVEAGEVKWINPFRGLSDAVVNTGLEYELSVLKSFAEPRLKAVEKSAQGYPTACRLLAALKSIDASPADDVPTDSILREAIGGSTLDYS